MKSHSIRTLAVLASAGLIVGAFAAGPADAAKKKKKKKKPKAVTCAPFTPTIEAAAEAPMVSVTEKATKEKPIVVEFQHPQSLAQEHSAQPDTQDEKYVNIQVVSKASQGLYILEEFSSRHDIDLHLYNAAGEEVASSGAFNPAPVEGRLDSGGNGGETFESIPGFPANPCEGYTAESVAYATPGTAVKMSIWVGEVTDTWTKP